MNAPMDFSPSPWQAERIVARSFPEVNAELICYALAVCEWLLPGGYVDGRGEYIGSGIEGGDGSSCGVNLATGKWNDFAVDEDKGGDFISLCAAVHDVSQPEALALCEEWLRNEAPDKPERAAPVGDDAESKAEKDAARTTRALGWLRQSLPLPETWAAAYLAARGVEVPDNAPLPSQHDPPERG